MPPNPFLLTTSYLIKETAQKFDTLSPFGRQRHTFIPASIECLVITSDDIRHQD